MTEREPSLSGDAIIPHAQRILALGYVRVPRLRWLGHATSDMLPGEPVQESLRTEAIPPEVRRRVSHYGPRNKR